MKKTNLFKVVMLVALMATTFIAYQNFDTASVEKFQRISIPISLNAPFFAVVSSSLEVRLISQDFKKAQQINFKNRKTNMLDLPRQTDEIDLDQVNFFKYLGQDTKLTGGYFAAAFFGDNYFSFNTKTNSLSFFPLVTLRTRAGFASLQDGRLLVVGGMNPQGCFAEGLYCDNDPGSKACSKKIFMHNYRLNLFQLMV
jgi:hypothetical protein